MAKTKPEQWRDRIVGHGSVAPSELVANPANWRGHPANQRAALSQVLGEVGWVQNVIVNQRTGRLIDGHLRLELAIERAEEAMPVVYVDLSEDEERRMLLTLDPLAGMAEANAEALAALLEGQADGNDAISKMLNQAAKEAGIKKAGLTEPDAVPAEPERTAVYVERGQVWTLGRHRIMCGDATERADVRLLLDRQRAEMMFTDPPYGVVFGAAKKNAISGDLTQAAIPISFAVAVEEALDDDARLYMCGGSNNWQMYSKLFDHHLQQQCHPIIWVKEAFVMRPNNYHSQFEIVYFGWKGAGGGADHWYGDRKHSDVWQFARDREAVHPTQKPVEMVSLAIDNSCAPNGLVYEPFSGSGTTIIAAERQGRALLRDGDRAEVRAGGHRAVAELHG